MKNIGDFLKIINEDAEIQELIIKSEILKKDFKVQTRKTTKVEKSKAGTAMKYLWESTDGIKLRIIFENKYGVNFGSSIQRGKIKDALMLYFSKAGEEEKC